MCMLVHMEAVWHQMFVRVGDDAVETVNQSPESHREAEAAADLHVLSGCRYNVRTLFSRYDPTPTNQTTAQHMSRIVPLPPSIQQRRRSYSGHTHGASYTVA